MKKLVLITFLILGITSVNGQEKDNFRIGADVGYIFSEDGGVLFSLEPKYNLTDNSNIGIRFGGAYATGDSVYKTVANYNIIATYDYYFNIGDSSLSPFLGAGLGGYILGDYETDGGITLFDLGNKFGGMIRGGLEFGKFRFTLEYNMIPKSDLPLGGSLTNSYFGASIGFYVGGGKW